MLSVKTLFNRDFIVTAKGDGAVGHIIECALGGHVSDKRGADLGFWEVKTKCIESNSKISLSCIGKTGSLNQLVDNAIAKMTNTIYVMYTRNGDIVRVKQVYILYSFNVDYFRSQVGGIVKLETRSNGEKGLRIAKGNFFKLYRQVTLVP